MAATGFTPIQLYRTTTGGATPSAANLVPGELAINIANSDMALFAENASGNVVRIMNNPAGLRYPTADGTNGQVVTTNGSGVLSFVTPAAGVSLAADNTWTGTQTFSGTSSKLAMVLNDAAEVVTVSATAATGTINYDITTQSVLYYTSNASGFWTINFRASSGTTLNSALAIGQSVTAVFMATNGATAFANISLQIDGSGGGITLRWQGAGGFPAGNANSIDAYIYTIIKTASATYTVLASQTRFA
jgi:hypothetical protein